MLYLLRNKKPITYDCYDSFLIEANSEEDAREIAQKAGADEIRKGGDRNFPFWTDEENSSCVLLSELKTKPGEIVLSSFNAG